MAPSRSLLHLVSIFLLTCSPAALALPTVALITTTSASSSSPSSSSALISSSSSSSLSSESLSSTATDSTESNSDLTPEISVSTITKAVQTIQIPSPPSETPDIRTLGEVHSILDPAGNPTIAPFPTKAPVSSQSSLLKNVPSSTYSEATTVSPSLELASSSGSITRRGSVRESIEFAKGALEESESVKESLELTDAGLEKRANAPATVTDLFTPIATSYPPLLFTRQRDHPVPRVRIAQPDLSVPIGTNKFYGGFFLGNQVEQVHTWPYSVWVSNVTTNDPFGLAIDHPEPDRRIFGPATGYKDAVEYYINPTHIRSLSLGSSEFESGKSSFLVSTPAHGSAKLTFYASSSDEASTFTTGSSMKAMQVPLCQGMGFVSALYNNLKPEFNSAIYVSTLTQVTPPAEGIAKWRVTLMDGTTWVIYVHPNVEADGTRTYPTLQIVNNGKIGASESFTGLIQVAKVSKSGGASTAVEAVLDATTGAYCNGVSYAAQVAGTTGSYQMTFTKGGSRNTELLMYALPHHVSSFESATSQKLKTALKWASPTKGMMTAVVSNTWRLTESSLPTSIGFLPIPSSGTATFTAQNLAQLQKVVRFELSQDWTTQIDLDYQYFAAKGLYKLAGVCITANDVLANSDLTKTCVAELKKQFARFLTNKQKIPLVYETAWKGIVSSGIYTTGDLNTDFGSGAYNDHHFHYGYYIASAAIMGYLDPSTLTSATKDWVNTLVRDVANPTTNDKYFPFFRSFDFFHGHSWAKGLFASADGKDEESSSEDAHFAYGMKLWGYVIGDKAMEARGNLLLAILKRSINAYMLMDPSTNTNHPANFVNNFVTGILFENKAHHTTYFGTELSKIQGIHMLPLSPISPYIRSSSFAQAEWLALFSGKTDLYDDSWKGVLYSNVALWDPRSSYRFFNGSTFQSRWLDGGASRSWYLAFAGTLGGAARNLA